MVGRGTSPIVLVLVVVLVLDFFGRGKRTDCQTAFKSSKIEDEDDEHEDEKRLREPCAAGLS